MSGRTPGCPLRVVTQEGDEYRVSESDFTTFDPVLAEAVRVELDQLDPVPCPLCDSDETGSGLTMALLRDQVERARTRANGMAPADGASPAELSASLAAMRSLARHVAAYNAGLGEHALAQTIRGR